MLRALIVQQVIELWMRLFNPQQARASWPALRIALVAFIRDHGVTSSLYAIRYYSRVREESLTGRLVDPLRQLRLPREAERVRVPSLPPVDAPGGITAPRVAPFTPEPAPVVADDVIGRNLDQTGLGAFLHGMRAGQSVETARKNAAAQLSGAASKLVLDAGRDTIQQAVRDDAEAIGWARVTDAKPCSFCAMLASRGPVYKSRQSAGFQAHNHCACVPAPVFSEDEAWLGHASDLYEQWQQVTAGKSGTDAMIAWRRHWEGR